MACISSNDEKYKKLAVKASFQNYACIVLVNTNKSRRALFQGFPLDNNSTNFTEYLLVVLKKIFQ
jgi:hypothetical protein